MATSNIDTTDHSRQTKTASGINVALGAWLVISPWIFGYAATTSSAAWNSIITGILVVTFGCLRYRSPHNRVFLSWANVVLGTWAVLSQWLYGYAVDAGPLWSSVVAGLVIVALAFRSSNATLAERRPRAA